MCVQNALRSFKVSLNTVLFTSSATCSDSFPCHPPHSFLITIKSLERLNQSVSQVMWTRPFKIFFRFSYSQSFLDFPSQSATDLICSIYKQTPTKVKSNLAKGTFLLVNLTIYWDTVSQCDEAPLILFWKRPKWIYFLENWIIKPFHR